jgi:hypothetical protein
MRGECVFRAIYALASGLHLGLLQGDRRSLFGPWLVCSLPIFTILAILHIVDHL